ncbi:uracil phosphoribosyltransferase [Candidatus Dependentiae bacterium]|nr:uracil phosphoribosyltransferase [Candidatus Dependentiae bacterium]
MKEALLTTLRNKKTSIAQFRQAAEKLGLILAAEAAQLLEQETISIETPLAKTEGGQFKNNLVLVPILRSGIALLNPFLHFFQRASVGFVGLQRDEKTAVAELYYYKMPPLSAQDDVILLDPMIATGGSAIDALNILKEKGAHEEKIVFVAIVAAPDGLERIKKAFPKIKIIVPAIDERLNNKKFIIPGLGDFGDRFFGTDVPG